MSRLIGQDYDSLGILEQWYDNGDGTVSIQRHDDAQGAVDLVNTANLDGVETVEGLGRPTIEVPIVLAMQWAERRGIPWEKLLYSNEYDAEFKKFGQEYSRLQYHAKRTVHAVQ
jgi:hypothetical protein